MGLYNRVVEPDALLPTCHALADDMTSCVPEVLRGYKEVIDRGFATSFGEGLEMEGKRSREQVRTVPMETLAERRKVVQARGRQQGDA